MAPRKARARVDKTVPRIGVPNPRTASAVLKSYRSRTSGRHDALSPSRTLAIIDGAPGQHARLRAGEALGLATQKARPIIVPPSRRILHEFGLPVHPVIAEVGAGFLFDSDKTSFVSEEKSTALA